MEEMVFELGLKNRQESGRRRHSGSYRWFIGLLMVPEPTEYRCGQQVRRA